MDKITWLLLLGVALGVVALVKQPPASAGTKGLDAFGRYGSW